MKKTKHVLSNRFMSIEPGDCIGFVNLCSCGKECRGWTKKESESEFEKHVNAHN